MRTVEQNTRRYVALCYRLQERRLTCARLLMQFQTLRRRYGLPVGQVGLSRLPLYTFTKVGGTLRMVATPCIEGGTGGFYSWTEAAPEAAVLHVAGEVDLATAPLLAHAIAEAFIESPRVIVDLTQVDYLNGSGIRILEAAATWHRPRFVVVGSKPEIHRLFDIMELGDGLPVVATIEDARKYFCRQQPGSSIAPRRAGATPS